MKNIHLYVTCNFSPPCASDKMQDSNIEAKRVVLTVVAKDRMDCQSEKAIFTCDFLQ
ncbi:MAG: hypothetical protein HYZ21_10205 [Chloroflexi bacterium]|nr:hypothetical protein [Chloroflexota bacterium]